MLPPHMEQGVLLISHLADSGLKPQHNGCPLGSTQLSQAGGLTLKPAPGTHST